MNPTTIQFSMIEDESELTKQSMLVVEPFPDDEDNTEKIRANFKKTQKVSKRINL